MKSFQQIIFMKEFMNMIIFMAMADMYGLMGLFIKGNLKQGWWKVQVHGNPLMEIYIKDNFSRD